MRHVGELKNQFLQKSLVHECTNSATYVELFLALTTIDNLNNMNPQTRAAAKYLREILQKYEVKLTD